MVSAAAKEPIDCGLTDQTDQYQYQYTTNVAVIFGVTGLVGRELAKRLSSKPRWKVYGIARFPAEIIPIQTQNYTFISCDLLNPNETKQKLSFLRDVTHMFWVTWASQFPLDSPECSEQNREMLSNALNVILPVAKSLKHLSLQTGLKHYASIQANSNELSRVYDEESPRVSSGYNFYYALEDLIQRKLDNNNNGNNKLGWSVHRPGLLLGSSKRTMFNFMGSLCVYAAICKHLSLPFVFGGKRECWEEFWIDGSDARLVAEQHIWAATNEEISAIDGQAFNSING
ncbi:3-oxo-Delta(4,5)-steroid 5-beta-reductase, partial [Carica papaya]|uniref:3-oxo-Delta(4,5)-steroid 5-beta-reductase n=1 Tax=Carica papaya TaxID=3649 RepID=UPI000B8C7166